MSSSATGWRSAIALVLALHLLSTASTWWITDHGEILAVASRFLDDGQLNLKNLDPLWSDWERIATARKNTDTRFLPLSILSLTPFLALDHALGLRAPDELRVVHLQGHVFVGMALLLIGRFLARSATPQTAALAVLLLGLNWPVWMIARRLGPEPVLLALIAAFAVSGPAVRGLALALLPWVHASGPLLGGGALLWLAVKEPGDRIRGMRVPALGLILGVLSVALLWNLPVHGHAFLGGYERFASDPFFTPRNPVWGVAGVLTPVLVWNLPLAWLTVRGGRAPVIETLALLLPATVFFGIFSSPEPERRLAPLVALWVLLVAARMTPLPGQAGLALFLFALVSSILGLSRDFVTLIETPLGVYAGPHLFLLRLAFTDNHPLLAAAGAALLLTVAGLASREVFRALAPGSPEVGLNHEPGPQLRS